MRISKETKKKMLIRSTLVAMDKQIQKLESMKSGYIERGREAKSRGLTSQYNLAVSGLRMCITQQKRIYEMKLNLEITSQMKDMAKMTVDFLGGMNALSKDMVKVTKEADFRKVAAQFEQAMASAENQATSLEEFMDSTSSAFSSAIMTNDEDRKEIDAVMGGGTQKADDIESAIDKELEALKKKM